MATYEDVAPALLEKIQQDFTARVKENRKLQDLLKLVDEGKATYIQAEELAAEMGTALSQAFGNCLSSAALPDGKMYYNIAQRVVGPMLREDHQLIAKATEQVQAALNKRAGIGLKSQTVAVDEDRIYGIVNKISEAEAYDDVAWVLAEPVVNFSQSVVDNILKANVNFQGKAGLTPKIYRKAERKCCKWCQSLAGVYDYPMVPDDVYRRHERCRCTVDYDPGDGRRQNVHTKQWKSAADRDMIKKRKAFSTSGSKNAVAPPKAGTGTTEKTPIATEQQTTRKSYTKKQLQDMPLEELREYTTQLATEWYKSGRSGISFPPGQDLEQAARSLNYNASRNSLAKDAKAIQNRLLQLDAEKAGNVLTSAAGQKVTIVQSATLEGIPNSITQTGTKKGSCSRNYYDASGTQFKQISNDDHGEPDSKSFGARGEHAHDYQYDASGNLESRPKRNLTDEERKENADIL